MFVYSLFNCQPDQQKLVSDKITISIIITISTIFMELTIVKFAGDPENITLMGYEAGAACIHYLMASPAVTPGTNFLQHF